MFDLPAPLVPPDADLQDFPFMPLQVARLRDSDFNSEVSDGEFRCAIMLWCASWHQVPAGSLPDSDATLMRLAGLGRDTRSWKKFKAGALYGFVKCSDGRLYHKTVAEQVAEAWESKLRQRHRTFCSTVRKHNQRHPDDERELPDYETWLSQDRPTAVVRDVATMSPATGSIVPEDKPPLSHGTNADVPLENGSKRQGQGQGQGQLIEEPDGSSPPVGPPSKSRGERLCAGWEPQPLAGDIATTVQTWPPGALERELARFRDWAASATGSVAVKRDWDAAWRNWLRKAEDDGRFKRHGNGQADRGGSTRAAAQLALGRLHHD